MVIRVLVIVLLMGLVPTGWQGAARAAETAGVVFRETLRVGETELSLRGTGLLRWGFFFRVYVAAFYLPPEVSSEGWIEDVPKRLEIHYLVDIPGEKFGPAAEPYLERNVPPEILPRLRPRIDLISAAYRDIAEGDRYALTYLPGRGTELAWNGEPLIEVEGADFARWYYTVWLGANPIDEGLRDALLGRPR